MEYRKLQKEQSGVFNYRTNTENRNSILNRLLAYSMALCNSILKVNRFSEHSLLESIKGAFQPPETMCQKQHYFLLTDFF